MRERDVPGMRKPAKPPGNAAPHGSTAIFRWPVRVYWEDTDAGGIVYYANYLKFFERARTEWLRASGFGQQALCESEGGMFVVADAQIRYLQPARLDDELMLTTWLQEAGRACMTIGQQAQLGTDPGAAVLCSASIRVSWVSGASFKPIRIPNSIVKALS